MSVILLSENTNSKVTTYLRDKGHRILEISKTPAVYDAVSSHADIYLCKLKNELVVSQEQLAFLSEELQCLGILYSAGSSVLGFRYPENIRYNAAQIGNYLIHNTRFTDPKVLNRAKELGLSFIHVRQGYTKCSLVIVDDHSAITSDRGIANVLTSSGIEILQISPGHVALEGFPYGFLGGASGRVGNEILFHGDLSLHPDFHAIQRFIECRGLQIQYFTEFPLEDIGSFIEV